VQSQTHNKLKIKAQAILTAQTRCNTLTHHFHHFSQHFKSIGSVVRYKYVETAPSVTEITMISFYSISFKIRWIYKKLWYH